jgi:hypothetical protein
VDAGHAFRAGTDVAKFLAIHAGRIAGVHLRDSRRGSEVPIGSGESPLQTSANALCGAAWQGWSRQHGNRWITGTKAKRKLTDFLHPKILDARDSREQEVRVFSSRSLRRAFRPRGMSAPARNADVSINATVLVQSGACTGA